MVRTIGDDGYLALTRRVLGAVDRLVAGVDDVAGLRVVVPPDSTLVALAADETCDVFTVADAMSRAGWWVQPQLSSDGSPPTLHLSLSAATADHVDELLGALAAATREAVAAGPVRVDRRSRPSSRPSTPRR